MIALIDADLVAFRCAASAENDGEEIALLRCEELMQKILYETQTESYKCFLTGSNNFRKKISSEYKANRKDKVPPAYLNTCREYLVAEWNAKVTDGYEADDALGFNQTDNSVILSIDKDLLQIKGKHYNWVKREFKEVTVLEGIKHFYKQLLIGDIADNVKGVDGIGKVKAAKLIDVLETEKEMYEVVKEKYNDETRFKVNCDLLWIWRNENERYSDRHVD